MEDTSHPGPGRPRDPRVDEAILEATRTVLRRRGWSATTMEEVAAEAGVGKPSIYRRYPSKVALVSAAAAHERDLMFPRMDTGTTFGDLTAFLLGSLRMLMDSVWHRVLPAILAEAVEDPEVATTVQAYWAWRRTSVAEILQRGVARREVRPDVDPEQVLDALDGPIMVRLLITRASLNGEFVDRLADQVMRMIGP